VGKLSLSVLIPEYRTFLKTVIPGKVSMKRRTEEITMAEKMKCEYCEKDAIGYQGFGCCSAYVCLDHADNFVLALKPGEKLTSGECYFERFSITD
jgi:hypothetical protein